MRSPGVPSIVAFMLLLTATGSARGESAPDAQETLSFSLRYVRSVYNGPPRGAPLVSAIAVDKDMLLLESEDNDLILVSVKDGAVVWRANARTLLGINRPPSYPMISAAWRTSDTWLELLVKNPGREGLFWLKWEKDDTSPATKPLPKLIRPLHSTLPRCPGHERWFVGVSGYSYGRKIVMIDLDSGEMSRQFMPKPAKYPIMALRFSSDGRLLAACGDSVYVWEMSTGRRINDAYQAAGDLGAEIRSHGGYNPSTCAFSPDGRLLVVGTEAERLLVFAVASGTLLRSEDSKKIHLSGPIRYATFVGGSRYVLLSANRVVLYDVEQWRFVEIPAFQKDERLQTVGGVVVVGHAIFICDHDGKLQCFDWTAGAQAAK